MSIVLNRVRRRFYLDSVALMRLSLEISAEPGILRAALMIGSPANRRILAEGGLLDDTGRAAGADDLVLAVLADGAAAAAAALDRAAARLDAPPDVVAGGAGHVRRPRSLAGAVTPASNLALISVPGAFAAAEARKALGLGLNVLLFSDNVALADEVALKQDAAARGLLMMGPDCGTAIVAGVPLGFANAVPPGDVGIVAASGTGLQEVSCLVARLGGGISHALGVGGRDLSAAVGGLATRQALALLGADPLTRHVVLISKPPAPEVAAGLLADVAALGKPVTLCFVGHVPGDLPAQVRAARTLAEAAELAMGKVLPAASAPPPAGRPGLLRGLFVGGTLQAEAAVLLGDIPALLTDFGDDAYTVGRPHPMIDPALRTAAFADALADPTVGVVLLDLVLGYGAHPDPAAPLVAALAAAPADRPPVVASVTGTDADPQSRARQVAALEGAGVLIAGSNAAAVRLAALLAAR